MPKQKVLIIENDSIIRRDLKLILEHADYQVFAVSDGASGMTTALQELPEYIICDFHLSDMDGFKILQNLRQEPSLADVYFIFCSGSSDIPPEALALSNGSLPKPFTRKQLLQALAQRSSPPRQS